MLKSRLLSQVSVTHGYSLRAHGDMRNAKNRETFARLLGLEDIQLIKPKQVHGNHIAIEGDGLVSNSSPLCVLTADCVPLLAVDPRLRVVGVAHAGWRGTLCAIAANLIYEMKRFGSKPSDIRISIGPHIRSCCYDVSKKRLEQFISAFGKNVVRSKRFLDLSLANVRTLIECGVLPEHIEDVSVCTACNHPQYFSYRKDDPSTFGEMIAVVGFQLHA